METTLERNPAVLETLNAFYEQRYDKFFYQVAKFVSKRGGVLDDAKDLYHDALVLYYEKLLQPGFELASTEEAYIMGIVKNLWYSKLKDDLKKDGVPDESDQMGDEPFDVDHHRLYNLIRVSGKKCLDLLSMFYIGQSAMKDVAEAFGFRSEHSATVQKYKCLEKIRDTVRQNALNHEDFFE